MQKLLDNRVVIQRVMSKRLYIGMESLVDNHLLVLKRLIKKN